MIGKFMSSLQAQNLSNGIMPWISQVSMDSIGSIHDLLLVIGNRR